MITKTCWGRMMRKFSWVFVVLLVGCGEVAANATITLVFDYPVESVTDAIGAGKKWTITPPQATMHIIWINLDGTEGRQTLNYKLKVGGAPFRRIY
ncbi:MAG: hypothetical protein QGH37_27165 [Candidatus Poribacteria bacterium]|nr:hypothetical protein [Candidatus Poribacteria bacterium]